MGNRPLLFGECREGRPSLPSPNSVLRTRTHTHTRAHSLARCFKFYANGWNEEDVSRPIVHCSLPKHLINGLIQALYVAHNKAQKHAGKECGGDEGLWIPAEPDHIKHLNHYPSSLSSSHHAVQHTVLYSLPGDLSMTDSSERFLQPRHFMRLHKQTRAAKNRIRNINKA